MLLPPQLDFGNYKYQDQVSIITQDGAAASRQKLKTLNQMWVADGPKIDRPAYART